MLPTWLKKVQSDTVGIEFLADGIAVAVRAAGSVLASKIEFVACEHDAQRKQLLKAWVTENRLSNAHANVALSANSYQMLLVEPPEVPAEELREAIRWRLKDLLTIPLEQAVIDVFALPEDGLRGNKKMVYAVAVERKRIEQLIADVAFAGLKLNAIDITELAIRNITWAALSPELKDRGVAVARLSQGGGSVFLFRQGNLYLARNFRLSYNAGLLDDLPEEALALELQRSVDYYERQMGQAPPAGVFICGDNVSTDKIGAVLRSSFAVPVNLLNPEVQADGEPDEQLTQTCLGALGAAMREQAA